MTAWRDDHELAEKLVKLGWEYEFLVAQELSKPEHGLTVEIPEKTWRSTASDAFRGSHSNEVDLVVNGHRLSVKSRRLSFTSPETIPQFADPLFVDTQRKWAQLTPEPTAVICISQISKLFVWLDVPATKAQWTTSRRFDHVRQYEDCFLQAARNLWQPSNSLVQRLK